MRKNLNAFGFTLIELIVALAVAAIIVTVAIPSFRNIIQNNRVATQSNELLTAFTIARSEALKRSIRVSVCSSADQSSCASSSDWATGWIVFTDDSGTAGTLDSTDVLLRVWDDLSGDSDLTQNTGGNNIQYLSNGTVEVTGTFTLTIPDGPTRFICINQIGRAQVITTACPT